MVNFNRDEAAKKDLTVQRLPFLPSMAFSNMTMSY